MRNPELLKHDVDDEDARRIMLAATPSLGFYAIVLALSVFLPKVAAFGFLAMAILAAGSGPGRWIPSRSSSARMNGSGWKPA